MDTSRLEDIVSWVKLNKKRIIYICLGLIVVYILAYVLPRYALVNISVTTTEKLADFSLYTSSNSEIKEIGKPGLHIVARDIKSVIAQAGRNVRTQSQATIPWYGFLDKKIDLKLDKNANKIAYKSTLDAACGTYSNKLDRMFQYKCSGSNVLTYFDAPTNGVWMVKTTGDMFYPNYTPVPYMGGLLGVAYAPNTDFLPPGNIARVDDDGRTSYYQTPEGVDLDKINRAKLFTDNSDQTNNRFVLVTQDGTVYLGAPESGIKVNYTKFEAPKDYIPDTMQTLCNLNDESVICYRGFSPDTSGHGSINSVKTTIVSLRFTSSDSVIKNVNSLIALQDLVVTQDGRLYGLGSKKLLYFEEKGDKYEPRELSQNIEAIVGGDTVYALQDNGVFIVDKKSHSLYQIFYSHNIKPKKLIASSGKVFILGKASNSNIYTYAWILNNEKDSNYGDRLIDKLPSFPASSAYSRTDLVGNVINMDIESDRSSTAQSIRNKRQDTLDYLRDMGVDMNQVQLNN